MTYELGLTWEKDFHLKYLLFKEQSCKLSIHLMSNQLVETELGHTNKLEHEIKTIVTMKSLTAAQSLCLPERAL